MTEETTRVLTFLLGDDTDCETCGTSYNEVEAWLDEDEWVVTLRYGCYGGKTVRGLPTLVKDKDSRRELKDLFYRARSFPMWSKANERAIKSLLGIKTK